MISDSNYPEVLINIRKSKAKSQYINMYDQEPQEVTGHEALMRLMERHFPLMNVDYIHCS